MITVLSPAKTLDFESPPPIKRHSLPEFLPDAELLVEKLAKMSKARMAKLMKLSDQLAQLNVERYRNWQTPFTPANAKQALLAFQGDVYQGFELTSWKAADYSFAQKHLAILSGLYGLLRPLDLMQPYRLEMGTPLRSKRGKDLYAFWGTKITDALQHALRKTRSPALVNLASNEYSNVIDFSAVQVPVITPVFKDEKNGEFKVISFFAKKARGSMANFIVRHRIQQADGLRDFDGDGYRFAAAASDETRLVFHRRAT